LISGPYSLAISAFGDVVGAAFDGEAEAVVFLPNSGDVLISALPQWQQLCAEASGLFPVAEISASEQDLRSTLLHLGAKIDG
jgi:hypothetical protein